MGRQGSACGLAKKKGAENTEIVVAAGENSEVGETIYTYVYIVVRNKKLIYQKLTSQKNEICRIETVAIEAIYLRVVGRRELGGG